MKKTILAVAIPSILSAQAQALEIIKDDTKEVKINARVQVIGGKATTLDTDNPADAADKNRKTSENGLDFYSRLGLEGKYKLTGDLNVIGKAEWGLKSEGAQDPSTSSLKPRDVYAGVEYNGLKVIAGRALNPFTQVADYSDLFNIFGGGIYGAQDGLNAATRFDDMLVGSYEANGLDVRVAGALGDANREKGVSGQKNLISASVGYTHEFSDNVKLGGALAYQKQNFVFSDAAAAGDKSTTAIDDKTKGDNDILALGLGLTVHEFYLGASVSRKEANNAGTKAYAKDSEHLSATDGIKQFSGKSTSFDITAKYTFAEKLDFMAGYVYENADNKTSGNVANDRRFVDAVILGTNYTFNDNFKVYAEYMFDNRNEALINNNMESPDNRYGVGATFKF